MLEKIRDIELHYETYGVGEPLLLLHGGTGAGVPPTSATASKTSGLWPTRAVPSPWTRTIRTSSSALERPDASASSASTRAPVAAPSSSAVSRART